MTTKLVNLPKNIAYPVRVIEVHVNAQQSVSAGDPLYTLETADNKRGIIRAPFSGQVSQGPVEPFTSFAQVMAVIGIDVSAVPASNVDVAPPHDSASVRAPEPTRPATPAVPNIRPSYGLALLALVGGVVLSAVYAAAVAFIPFIFFSMFVPLTVAFFLMIVLGRGLRGPAAFRITVTAVGWVLNILTIWFTVFWIRLGLDEAIVIFAKGPQAVLDTIVMLSRLMEFKFGDAKDVLGGSGIPVTGPWLLAIWAIEAAAFAAAGVLGYVAGSERQHEPAGAQIRESIAKHSVPFAAGILIGLLKLAAKLAFVAVFLALILYLSGHPIEGGFGIW
ncbi:MAG: hypothetical protein RIC14_00695 [Filomicrobium sp.]